MPTAAGLVDVPAEGCHRAWRRRGWRSCERWQAVGERRDKSGSQPGGQAGPLVGQTRQANGWRPARNDLLLEPPGVQAGRQ